MAVEPVPAEAVKGDHQRQPIVPEQWQRHNIRGTVSYLAGLHWHRARFHGLRSPAYLVRCVFYALRGGARLTGRVGPVGSLGRRVEARKHGGRRRARGPPRRHPSAHRGRKTRGQRSRSSASCAAVRLGGHPRDGRLRARVGVGGRCAAGCGDSGSPWPTGRQADRQARRGRAGLPGRRRPRSSPGRSARWISPRSTPR